MRQILHTYKLRLTNLSQANRSLRLGTLGRQREIDLCDLGQIDGATPAELLQRLLAGRDLTLLARLDPRFEPANLADRRLNAIYRTTQTLLEETGSYDLFVGYPFVEGKFADGTIARCPVLLFPVRLVRNLQGRPRWKLDIPEDEAVVFNRTFFLAYERYQLQRLDGEFWDEEIEPGKDWQQWLTALYEKIKAYDLAVNFNPRLFDQELVPFPNYRKADMEAFRTGLLTFRSHAVLGIFSQSDSALMQDYDALEREPERFDLGRLLGRQVPPPPAQPYIREESRYFIYPVDESQETALLRIKQGESLLVQGPPGTGKSQVIVNLLADALAHGKRVLVVSQKRAALDVVHKRLRAAGLGQFAVLVHDYRHDRAAIFRQIRQQIEAIPAFERELRDLNLTQWDHQYKRLSREADQYHRKFEDLYEALVRPQAFGLSMHTLYQRHEVPAEPLSLPDLRIDADLLETALRQLEALLDYAEFLPETYPWHDRLPMHAHGQEAQATMQALLKDLGAQIDTLHREYAQLSERLSSRILEPELTTARMAAFHQLDTWVQQHTVREDLGAIQHGGQKADQLGATLDACGKAIADLAGRKLLDDGHWSLLSSLIEHDKAYAQWQDKPLRWVSIAYQRARWFWRRVLAVRGLELNAENFGRIRQEVQFMHKLHRLYVRHHDHPLLADLPLLGPQREKEAWLQRKRQGLAAFQHLKSITYFRHIKPRFRQGQFDAVHWQTAMQTIGRLERFLRQIDGLRAAWRPWLSAGQIARLLEGIREPAPAQAYARALADAYARDLADLQQMDRLLEAMSPTVRQLFDAVRPCMVVGTDRQAFLLRVRQSIYAVWIESAERQHPVLTEVSTRGWSRVREAYVQTLDARREKLTELIRQRLKDRVVGILEYNRLKNPVTYRKILHQVSKQRRVWSMRRLVQETWQEGLQELVPCWLASPESVAAIFPMEPDFFDLVVFDEASQCFVERAVPVMLRAPQCVIAGDEQQLRPLDLYRVRREEGEEEFVENEMALEVRSILDLAKATFASTYLLWHYRSQAGALINFSNYRFYEGRLQVIPPARPDLRYQPVIEWVSVTGHWTENRNAPEALRVLDLVRDLVARPVPPTIGIVTFNYQQQEYIKDLLEAELEQSAANNPVLYSQLQASMQHMADGEFQGLFVKNIENVQGDERDVIIFSIGYAPDDRGRLAARFGLLNQQGGEHRLNVAITRARHKCYVVCSFLPSMLEVETSAHAGPRLLRDYLQYAYAVSNGETVSVGGGVRERTAAAPGTMAARIAARLEAAGYWVIPDYGDTTYRLDLAVKATADAPDFLLGIECEGPAYFSGASPKEREVYRPEMLIGRGWALHRVWSRNFLRDPDKEMQMILDKLAQIQSKR
ncbi:MAG: hypothetical protein OHK0039_03150 [Bacteroidia bacterium]